MKAIRVHEFGGPEVMRLEDVPDPTPGPGQVVVRIHAAGVNPVDTYIRSGNYGRMVQPPYTPGIDGAGVVETVGEGVTRVKAGDRVYTSAPNEGTYAELARIGEGEVWPLPETASFAQGAAVNVPYATAYQALVHRAQGRPGETVLVHGASGGVGVAAVQIAASLGLTVIGTAGTDEGLKLIQAQGAHHALNHREEGYLQKVTELTGGRGADVILEMLANVNLENDLGVVARRGRIVVIGNRGRIEIDPRATMSKDAAILGMTLFNATPEELMAVHAALYAGLANGTLKPVVGREFPLSDAPEAHEAVMSPGAHGKIVLLP
jgi:NADPH2:quinone reductase